MKNQTEFSFMDAPAVSKPRQPETVTKPENNPEPAFESDTKLTSVVNHFLREEESGRGYKRGSVRFVLQVVDNVNPDDGRKIREELKNPDFKKRITLIAWCERIRREITKIEKK